MDSSRFFAVVFFRSGDDHRWRSEITVSGVSQLYCLWVNAASGSPLSPGIIITVKRILPPVHNVDCSWLVNSLKVAGLDTVKEVSVSRPYPEYLEADWIRHLFYVIFFMIPFSILRNEWKPARPTLFSDQMSGSAFTQFVNLNFHRQSIDMFTLMLSVLWLQCINGNIYRYICYR